MKPKLILCTQPPKAVVESAAREFTVIDVATQNLSAADVAALAKQHQVDAIMLAMGQRFGPKEVEALPSTVRIVATNSVGYDHLDIAAFNRKGIWATNTPDVLTDATADLAMLLLLGASRRVLEPLALVAEGWGKKLGQADMLGLDLRGKSLGILGMGRIGQAFADRARAFGMQILYSNRNPLPPEKEKGARYFADFQEMLPHCQVLSLHAPGSKETENIMGAQEFAALPPNAVFINVARGTLVDESALAGALKSGHLFAAGLDVCWDEPHPSQQLMEAPNLMLTPNIGSATLETRVAMGQRALNNIRHAVKGEDPPDALRS